MTALLDTHTGGITIVEPMTRADYDQWEALVSAGIQAYDAKDRAHYELGRLASAIEKDYGNDSLGKYAADINAERARLSEYRTVWNFYQFSASADFSELFPNLRYSHYRDAMRFGAREKSLAFLTEASDATMTVEAARVEIAKRLGKPVGGRKMWEQTCEVWVQGAVGRFTLPDISSPEAQAEMRHLAQLIGNSKRFVLRLYAVDTVEVQA